jgi:hypothetical protein
MDLLPSPFAMTVIRPNEDKAVIVNACVEVFNTYALN